MKVILLKDISKVGSRFDVKEVSSGHALNMLIPQGLAVAATPSALKKIEQEKKIADGERRVRHELLTKNLKGLEGITITITGKMNDKGHLFAGLHREAIAAELLKQTELQIDPAMIKLDHAIKESGEHMIEVQAEGKSAKFKLVVSKL